MAAKKNANKSLSKKAELKKELVSKISSALPEMKQQLGEKKFERRVKKATKMIVHGLHSKDLSINNGFGSNGVEAAPKKSKAVKKAAPKKS